MDIEDTPPSSDAAEAKRAEIRATARFAQWLNAGMAAGSLAVILLILGQEWHDSSAKLALTGFCVTLPMFVGAVMVYGEPRRMYHLSALMKWIPVLSVLVFAAGLALLVSRIDPMPAVVFAVSSLLAMWILADSHHRHSRSA